MSITKNYMPTALLRFVQRTGYKPFDIYTSRMGGPPETTTYNILQQAWQHEETGRIVWQDVPVVKEE